MLISIKDIVHPVTNEIVAKKDDYIDEILAEKIETAGIQNAYIRSPLTCDSKKRNLCEVLWSRSC